MPSVGEVKIDRYLTNYSVAYKNDDYIADRVCPVVDVDLRSNKYVIYDQTSFMSSSGLHANGKARSLRAPRTVAVETEWKMSSDSYLADEYARREFVEDVLVQGTDAPMAPLIEATEQVNQTLLLDNELMVARLVMETNNYPTAGKKTLVTGAGSAVGDSSWKSTSQANSAPFVNFQTAKLQILSQIFKVPNAMAISFDASQYLANHPTYIDRYKYVSKEGLTIGGLHPMVYGFDVNVATQYYNTAAIGLAMSAGAVWSSVTSGSSPTAACLIYYNNPQKAGLRTLHAWKTFQAPDQTTQARGIWIRRYRQEDVKGQWVEGAFTRDYKAICVDGSSKFLGGYLLSDVIS